MPRFLALLLLAALAAAPAAAQDAPREVSVGVYLLDITTIDEIGNSFTAEADVFVSWRDPEHAFDPAEHGAPLKVYRGAEALEQHAAMWTAQIAPTNPIGNLSLGGQKMVVHPDGLVELTARITSTLRARLDYRRFPSTARCCRWSWRASRGTATR